MSEGFMQASYFRTNINLPSAPVSVVAPVTKIQSPASIINDVDAFLFDCDGVIWKGNSLISGASEVIAMLRKLGKKIFFVTNNSTKSRKGYLKKFTSLGLDISYEEIFSSSFAAAAYFEQHPLPAGSKVYIIGQEGICEELALLNIPYLGGPADANKVVDFKEGVQQDPSVSAVVVGLDTVINYYKIQYAQLCINNNANCQFIATNLDAVTHLTEDQEWSGAGSCVGAIKGCTNREPLVVGKPSPLMIEYIADKHKLDHSRICMVGDRLDTDIAFGRNNGLKTVLVLSGVTCEAMLNSPNNAIKPDYVTESIADFLK